MIAVLVLVFIDLTVANHVPGHMAHQRHQMVDNDVLLEIEDEKNKMKVVEIDLPPEILAQEAMNEAVKTKSEGRRKRGRVIGGTDVKSKEEYPFYASLRTSGSHQCGATILGKLIRGQFRVFRTPDRK